MLYHIVYLVSQLLNQFLWLCDSWSEKKFRFQTTPVFGSHRSAMGIFLNFERQMNDQRRQKRTHNM